MHLNDGSVFATRLSFISSFIKVSLMEFGRLLRDLKSFNIKREIYE